MIIIGERTYVLNHLWHLITTPTQWTQQMERTMHMLTINSDEEDTPARYILDIGTVHPFKLCDVSIPSDNTGFVYLLCSTSDANYSYIGQCEQLDKRLDDHNSGNGAFGTSDYTKRPFHVAGFITGLKHYDETMRMSLEHHWQDNRDHMIAHKTVLNILDVGERLVMEKNQRNPHSDPIVFVRMISRA
jgi:predicted GIY-YIG superfamily endonuclease